MKNSDNIVLIDLNTIDSIPGRRHRHKAIAYINTLCGTIIYPHISQTILEEQVNLIIAFGIYLSRQFIADIPDSLCEAAKIDGANSWRIYWHVILPNIKPAIGALGIFTALGIWNDYLSPLIMLNDIDKMTLPLALAIFSNQYSTDITTTMAAAAMIMCPIIIVFLLFQKQFVQSVVLSGMK